MKDAQQNKDYFKAHIEDKHRECFNKNIVTTTGFLDLAQQTQVLSMSRCFRTRYALYGGYEDAERKMLFFLPDYAEDVFGEYMVLLRAGFSERDSLSHRDFLGSVLATGITRENVGDIIICPGFAQLIVKSEMAQFLEQNYCKAGRKNLETGIFPLDELSVSKQEIKKVTDTVASLRLDSVVASAFCISRSAASQAILSQRISVNDVLTPKSDKPVSLGDKIRFRGKGKAILSDIGGKSRKDRIFITLDVYV